ncbi:hypothetical protein CR513_48216, partial [Mucuna pruriens]
MKALEQSGTWELVSLPSSKKTVGCRCVFAIKVAPNDIVDRLKAQLVAKGYTQVYGLDYGDTFSPVAKITTIRLLLAMAAIRHWPLHQLDIKNAFLHGDLDEEIYMEQPPGFVAQGESSLVCKLRRSLYGLKQSPRAWFGKFSQVVQNFRMTRSEVDDSVFYCHSSFGKCVYLVVYVDDIVITGNEDIKISQLKQYLFSHFQTKDLSHLKYFLGIEVAQSKEGIAPCVDHWAAVLHILRYIKKTPGHEYRAMASVTCELIWVKQLIQELKFADVQPMKLYCDNQATLHIASNPNSRDNISKTNNTLHFYERFFLIGTVQSFHFMDDLFFGRQERLRMLSSLKDGELVIGRHTSSMDIG